MSFNDPPFCDKVSNGTRFRINPGFQSYQFSSDFREISFFSRKAKCLEIGIWDIPQDAIAMEIEFHKMDGSYLVLPVFYDSKGNVLKRGCR